MSIEDMPARSAWDEVFREVTEASHAPGFLSTVCG
jgi:hypothetical protein